MFSKKVVESLGKSSMIRAMFEEGERLKKIHGPDNVFDFSIGNPDIEPPEAVLASMKHYLESGEPGLHRYMSNAGFPDVREKVAKYLEGKSNVSLSAQNILMVCGAAAGLNITLKALLNPGDEVIVLSPYFVEYLSYIDNAGGKPVIVNTLKESFQLDVEALEQNITVRTKAIILNSPNNPTGVIYKKQALEHLKIILEEKEEEYGANVFIISDEPYVSIVYDNAEVPNMLSIFNNCILVNSFSKSLALPGERIGYVAASSKIEDVSILMGAMTSLNRTLGFVNAPALFQKVIADNLEVAVDTDFYQRKRDKLYNHIKSIGFSCIKPQGAFYLFMKTPVEDDKAFCGKAVQFNLLIVPGSNFGCPGYARIAYCFDDKVIEGSLKAFTQLAQAYGLV